ncbi:MAG: hypothetical protein GY827_05285 [Cytophagales bacterium]|nr:hypothetical protein [Cytophagales bacterium]
MGISSEYKKKYQKAEQIFFKLLDYVQRKGGLKYIVYKTKQSDSSTTSIFFHKLKDIEVARLELAIEKIDELIDFSTLQNHHNQLQKAISSTLQTDISPEDKKVLEKNIDNFALIMSATETKYFGVIEMLRKYPTMKSLEKSKEAQKLDNVSSAQDLAVSNDIVSYGDKKVVSNNYKQIGIIALVVIAIILMNKFL